MDAIKTKKLVVKKGKSTILHDLNFAIREGTITGFIGPSGAGKTTLMRAIVGVQKYDGELRVLGSKAGSAKLRSKIGYVTQSPAVYDDLTVRENLRFFASIEKASKKQVEDIIRAVSLEGHETQLVGSLSGGQKARVSLAVALLGEPDLLVLDEPTVGLDPLLRDDLWNMFSRLAAQGKTLIVSSHVMDEASRCDDLLLIRDGHILWNDTRAKLLATTKTRDVGAAFVSMIKEAK